MRSIIEILLVFCFCITGSISGQSGQPDDHRSLHLLARNDGTWCAFGTEQAWNTGKKAAPGILVAGKVDYKNGRVASVYVTTADESGDWITVDRYTLDKDQKLVRLERTIRIPDGLEQDQQWVIKDGQATEAKSTNRDFARNETVPDGKISVPDTEPVITRTGDFPFWPLVTEQWQRAFSNGKACLDRKK